MFCTGGIRCEKASVVMLNEGYQEVYQIHGGILNYFEETGGAHWNGECFVFDRRVGVDGELNETTSEVCWACREPLTPEQAASPEFVESLLSILHWLKTGIHILNIDFWAMNKPKLAVSSCLLGKKVRYNGDAAEFRPLNRIWSEHLELIGVCPEVGIGMGVPRPTIRLVKGEERISLIDPKNGHDYTDQMLEYAEVQSDFLVASGISGFVFKKDSPSCGLERVKVYRGDNPQAVRDGTGLFAKVFTTLYPHIPVIEEGRLTDPLQAEHFLQEFTSLTNGNPLEKKAGLASKLMTFHAEHKLFYW